MVDGDNIYVRALPPAVATYLPLAYYDYYYYDIIHICLCVDVTMQQHE